MKKMKKQCWCFRILFYILSLVILALGITLNTKTGLGVSPIISVSYSVSQVLHLNFGNVTLIWYTIFVFIQLIIRGKKRRWYDLLQIPLSIVFTRFLNLFDAAIHWESESFAANLLLLLAAIVLKEQAQPCRLICALCQIPEMELWRLSQIVFTEIWDLPKICLT